MKHKKDSHIIYIITKLELGGAQKVCLSLFDGMQHNNITTTLISGTKGPLTQQVANNTNVILLKELTRELQWFGFIRELHCLCKLIKTLRRLKKKYPSAIVHTHSTKAGILGRWAAFFAGINIRVHTVHGYAFHTHQNRLVWFIIYVAELITSFITTHFVCVSCADVKTGTQLIPFFARKHSIIRAAVDWHKFLPTSSLHMSALKSSDMHSGQAYTNEPRTSFIFGTVSCFKPQKNLFDLLNAFKTAYIHNNNIRLELIGDGTLREKIELWIQQHALDDVITLHGWQENVAQIMYHWHAFVMSSLWEGLPCAIVEARLLKLPVLSYDTGGIRDVIISGKNGMLFKQGDWHGLTQGMLKITQDENYYNDLCNYKEELDDFKINVMIEKHIKLYRYF